MSTSLSVIVITKNEEKDLARCLRSVWFADEIIVLDSGSTDRTIEIAQQFTDKVYHSKDWPGFGPQKNNALSYATSDWVLSLDADEWVTPELSKEIQQAIHEKHHNVFNIPRLSSCCGTIIHHGGWYPDYIIRLFKRGSAQFSEDLVHECITHQDVAGQLTTPIRHESYKDINEVMQKVTSYATVGAENRFLKEEKSSFTQALFSSTWAFIRTWIIRLGFLDGKAGLMIAFSIAQGTYYRHLRLLELQQAIKKPTSVTLIITTYNRPDALDLVLLSIASLEQLPNEIIIADDGSKPETKRLIEQWQPRLPITHIWQEDNGFRAAKIRNLAVMAAQSDYLIFLDGDCLVRTDFITHHLQIAELGHIVPGSRVLLSESLTDRVLKQQEPILQWKFSHWLFAFLLRRFNRVTPFISLPNGNWRKWRNQSWGGVRACNLGIWRADFLAVNGFDETFREWGYEDADLAIRLYNNGVRRKDGNFGAPVIHMWHPTNHNYYKDLETWKKLQDTLSGKRPIQTKQGIDQYD